MKQSDIGAVGARASQLPRVVLALGWISLFTDIASEMVYPVVPLFLSAPVIAGGLGASALALGAIEGVAEAIVSVMKGLSGWHSDRLQRRVPYIRWGYGLGNGAKVLLAVAFAWPMVFVARMVDRFGKGLRTTARDALIADAIVPGQTGRAFGLHRAMDTAGAFVGVVIAAVLLYLVPGRYRLIFGLALIPGILAVILTFRLREAAQASEAHTTIARALKPSIRSLPRSYWRICGVLALFALANSSDMFLLRRAQELGLSDSEVVLTYALYNLSYAVFAYPAGILSDRFGRRRIIGLGWLLYAGVYAGFALSDNASALWGLFLAYGVYMGLTQGVGKALIVDFTPATARGTALGMFHLISGFAVLLSSLLAGWLWDAYGASTAFGVGSVTALVALGLLPLLPRKSNAGNGRE